MNSHDESGGSVSDLAGFLLARIAEDEAKISEYERDYRVDAKTDSDPELWIDGEYAIIVIGPGRVLAECQAKKRIIEGIGAEDDGTAPPASLILGDDVLKLLALPYVGHRDYRAEWRP